jgi:hypothetical protein
MQASSGGAQANGLPTKVGVIASLSVDKLAAAPKRSLERG